MYKLPNVPRLGYKRMCSVHTIALSQILGFSSCNIARYLEKNSGDVFFPPHSILWANRITEGVYLEDNRIIETSDMNLDPAGNTITDYRAFRISPVPPSDADSKEVIIEKVEDILKDTVYLTGIINYCKINNINIPNYSDDVQRIVDLELNTNHRL